MNYKSHTLLLCLSFSISTITNAQESVSVSTSDMVKLIQMEQMNPVFQYCKTQLPDLQEKLDSAYGDYKEKFDSAMDAVVNALGEGAKQTLSQEDFDNTKSMLHDMGMEQLDNIRQLDPNEFCPSLLDNIGNATKESLQARMETAFKQYEARLSEKKDI